MRKFQIAIDGPAGSGKSTISKLVSKELNFTHIDTGAMYRAVTLEALNRKIDLENPNEYGFLDDIKVQYLDDKIYLNGIDVSKEIRKPYVTNNTSIVAKMDVVRKKMVSIQQDVAKDGLIVMDGRDIGYVVLPNADVKVYLTASVDVRAKRRMLEEPNRSFEEIKEEIVQRDFKDSNRKLSPLKMADDAVLIDTTNLSIEEVVQKIIKLVKERF